MIYESLEWDKDKELKHLNARVAVLEAELAEKQDFIDDVFEVHPNVDLDVEYLHRRKYPAYVEPSTKHEAEPKMPEEEIFNLLGDDSV